MEWIYTKKKRLREIEKLLQDKEYVLLMLCRQPVKKLVSALEWNLEPCLEPIVIKGLFLMMMIWTLPCGQKTVLGILKMYYLNMVSIKKRAFYLVTVDSNGKRTRKLTEIALDYDGLQVDIFFSFRKTEITRSIFV